MTLLGIDIGGTGIKGAPVDVETGQLTAERFRIETPQPSVPNAVADVVKQVAAHFNYSGPAGVTFPAVVKHGVTYTAANVDRSWIGTNAGELFSRHIGGPVTVVNDAVDPTFRSLGVLVLRLLVLRPQGRLPGLVGDDHRPTPPGP